jgi:hypothetical protein
MHAYGRRWTRTLLAIVLVTVAACGSDSAVTDPASGTPTPAPPPEKVLLKDVQVDRLPSPYYHFVYDASGTITNVSFASGLTNYGVTYLGTRIKELQNNTLGNRDRLVYAYDSDGRVVGVRYVNASGETFTIVIFSYDGDKLTEVERSRAVPGGFIIDKTMTLSYWPDGNLRELAEHRPAIDGVQGEGTGVVTFEQYDTGLNVDSFGLIHDDFFDHFVLLPGVVLQKNNPGRETRTGDGLTYIVDYTYQYSAAGRPLTKRGDLLITGGTGEDIGRRIQIGSSYTYY